MMTNCCSLFQKRWTEVGQLADQSFLLIVIVAIIVLFLAVCALLSLKKHVAEGQKLWSWQSSLLIIVIVIIIGKTGGWTEVGQLAELFLLIIIVNCQLPSFIVIIISFPSDYGSLISQFDTLTCYPRISPQKYRRCGRWTEFGQLAKLFLLIVIVTIFIFFLGWTEETCWQIRALSPHRNRHCHHCCQLPSLPLSSSDFQRTMDQVVSIL